RPITARNIESIITLSRPFHSGRRVIMQGRSTVSRQFENLIFQKTEPGVQLEFNYGLPIPGQCRVPESGLEFRTTLVESIACADSATTPGTSRAVLDVTSLPGALSVRSRHPGDRYGGPRHRKVKKMLIDAKVPLSARSRVAVVVAGEVVIWIPGFKPAKQYIARPDSGRCVLLEARPLTETSHF
ncbi:MAG TPA: tRNA lysidine(34) synthetase TilS, partial [Acidobacteriota bacterium]|nr:tRNA lysidine(34) synthetase TilS [Acidobacteriota bacterium]